MRRITLPALTALALCLGACSDTPPPVNKAAIEKSVREAEANQMAAKDAAALVANFTTDAVIMAPGVTMKGAEAIRAAMPRMLADPNNKLELIADRVEVADAGDMAATSGKFTRTSTDPATKKSVTAKGSYVTVFRKQQDGAWKMALQIYANDSPSPAPLAARAAARLRKGKKR